MSAEPDWLRVARDNGLIISERGSQPVAGDAPKRPKYGNRKCEIDGITFDSKREAQRYLALRDEQRTGLIEDLRLQVPYRIEAGGVLICKYIADFVYRRDGAEVVEDAKGMRTPVYRLKKKLMKAFHNVTITEV